MLIETQPETQDEQSVSGVLPHSREAEEAVIGAVLINPEVYDDLREMLKPDDFYIHRLRFVWESYIRLFDRQCPIDILTVSEELNDMGRLDDIGGQAFLTALLNQVPTTLHAEAYGKIIKGDALRRNLLTLCNSVATKAYDGNIHPDDIISASMTDLESIASSGMEAHHGLSDSRAVMSAAYDQSTSRSVPGVKKLLTGFVDLDALLKRLDKTNLYFLAGRPGMGKTALLLAIMWNALKAGFKVLLFSLEMSKEQIAYRLLSLVIYEMFNHEIENDRIGNGELTDDEWHMYAAALERLESMDYVVDDTRGITPALLRTRTKLAKRRYGVDLVLLDYIQLMEAGVKRQSREQEISHISRQVKNIAGEMNVPLLAACQMSRAIEARAEKEPQLSDLRESGALEQDADVVMFVYNEEKLGTSIRTIKVAKHRNGPTGVAYMIFRGKICKFENAALRKIPQET